MLRLAPKLGNWLRQAHGKHERSEKNEKNQKNNTGQERHRHHTRSTTHGRHRRRRSSHGLRMVNRTTQRPTRTKPSTQRIPERGNGFVLEQQHYDNTKRQKHSKRGARVLHLL